MNRRVTLAIRILVIGVIAAALWWFVREMNFAALGKALRSAKVWPLVLAAALNFVCLWGKAVCWRIMLAPRHKVSVARLFRYTIAAFAASAIAPARAGEVLRVWTLKRRDGVPAADTAAVAVAEKLLDGISMLILVAPVPLLLHGLPRWVVGAIALCAAIAVALFIGLFIAVGRVGDSPPVDDSTSRSLVRRFLAGMHVLRSPKRLLGSLLLLILVWSADLGEVMAVLYAVDIHLPVAAGLLILFTLNLTIAVPSTPAQVGALEVGALAALDLLHVGHEQALAFALLYHALQVVPLIAAGMILELRLVLGREDEPLTNGAERAPPPAKPVVAASPSSAASSPPSTPHPSHTRP
ncbi:MAG TPA: lysylphosphatidylglycerol synthase transmembrane domain-containing protein [Kofleriaceae bacterium]|nr:lysylphosphatidylglycerol synthase transmembrane domain-containing protein [Kofleriaceae bacterium]